MYTFLILSFSETALENLKKTALLSKPTPLNFFNFYLFQILKIFAGVSANLRQRKFFSKFFTFFKLAETEYIGLAEFLSASSARGACLYLACLPPNLPTTELAETELAAHRTCRPPSLPNLNFPKPSLPNLNFSETFVFCISPH